ncbi:MAG: DMT family transporter [Chlorobi bacterium]|nr:DMT family transporter [Chlorobiota bacterium]
MYTKYLLVTIALLIGGLLSVQGSINSHLGAFLKHPLQAAFVNFFVGAVVLLLLNILLRTEVPHFKELGKVPVYLFFGGMLGAIYVTSAVILIPKIGVSSMLAASIAGQLIISSVIDHFGFFNVPLHPFTLGRMAGIVLLLTGIFLIQRF